MRVAVGQFAATRDTAANRARVVDLIGRAADRGADLVVLPEASMHPFGGSADRLTTVAEPLDGPFATAVAEAAAAAGLVAVAGMFESVPGEDRVWNTVVAAGPDGPLGHYRKLHLFDALGWRESDRVRPADLDPADPASALLTLGVGELTVGVLTCYDLRFPELSRALVDAGATLLAVPSAWVGGPLKEMHWLTLATARAIENTCYLAAADQAPPDYSGQSVLVDPMGVPLARLGEVDGAVAVAEVSAGRVEEVRKALPVLANRRFQVVPGSGTGAGRRSLG
jgi:predicted amidohydrolase